MSCACGDPYGNRKSPVAICNLFKITEKPHIVGFIVDEICSPLPYTTLRGTSFPRSVIKSKMLQANIYMVESVLVKMAQVDNIKDFRRYFISSLYNEVLTYHFNEGCESRWAVQAVARDFGYAV